jgi:hypothetical protein
MNKLLRILLAGAAFATSASGVCAEVYGSLTAPGVYFGTGNPNGAFNIDPEGGLELGLRAKNRSTIGPVLIDGSSGAYSVNSGFCGPSCGGAGTRAKWNYEFSIHTTNGSVLSDYVFMLGVDHDPSAGTSFTYVNPLTNWSDDRFDGNLGAQNSQNVTFGDTPGGAISPKVSGMYDFVLFAYNKNDATQTRVAQVDMTVSVPEPGTVAMFGLGLASLFALRRRKAKQS